MKQHTFILSGLAGLAIASTPSGATPLDVPLTTRQYWMHQTTEILINDRGTRCPTNPFTTVIVNHTDTLGLGDLICSGVNAIEISGDASDHGEVVAIRTLAKVLTDPNGKYRLSPAEAREATKQLSLYTNCEACPMCATAIRWSGFREYIFGSKIETAKNYKWQQLDITSAYVFDHSHKLPTQTAFVGSVLSNETDPLFAWQFTNGAKCPSGCNPGKQAKCVDDAAPQSLPMEL